MSAQRIVETPRMGMLPTTIAIATHSASRRGDMPCRNNASNGSKILRFSQSFKGYSVVRGFSNARREYDIWLPGPETCSEGRGVDFSDPNAIPRELGVARNRAKPLKSGKEMTNVQ